MTERPDGGWGWIIAIATFSTNVIVDGVKYSFGIMFVELVETFERSKSETSWIMSIQVGIMLLSGPVVAALVNRFGCKTIALAGTMLSFTGFVASTFVRSLFIMCLTFGLLTGFGFGMMVMPAVVTLARYFDKRLAFASGIAAMGSGFGTLVFNPLSKILIDRYTWRGTLLIEAGIVLNGLLCALVLNPRKKTSVNMFLNVEANEEDDKSVKSRLHFDGEPRARNDNSVDAAELLKARNEFEVVNVDTNTELQIKSCIDTEDQIKNISSRDENSSAIKVNAESEDKHTCETDLDVTVPLMTSTNEIMKVTVKRFDVADTSQYENKFTKKNDGTSVYSEKDCNNCEEISIEICDRTDTSKTSKVTKAEVLTVGKHKSTADTNKAQNDENTDPNKRRWFSLAPLKNPAFICFLLSGILIEMSLNTPFTFLPDMMLHKGFEKEDAVWMLFIIGLVSTISRIVIGFIADLRFVNRVKLCNSIVVLNGIFVVLCPFCFNYASFVAFSVLFGFSAGLKASNEYVWFLVTVTQARSYGVFAGLVVKGVDPPVDIVVGISGQQSSSSSLRYVLVPDLFGIEMIADLYGINMFFSAFAAFIGLPKAGALFDATGNYMVPFVVAGAELTVSGMVLFLIPSVQRCSKVSLPRR